MSDAQLGEWLVEEEAGMAQLDDDVGLVMKKLKDMGEDQNTIVLFTTDNGTEVFTWPDGGQTPFAQSKEQCSRAAFACLRCFAGPVMCRGLGAERHLLRPGLVPHLPHRAGNPNITEQLLKG